MFVAPFTLPALAVDRVAAPAFILRTAICYLLYLHLRIRTCTAHARPAVSLALTSSDRTSQTFPLLLVRSGPRLTYVQAQSQERAARSEHPSSTSPRRDSDPHRRKDTRGLRGLNAEPWSLEGGGFHGLPQAGQRICRRGRRWRSSSKEKRAIGCRGEGRGVRRVRRTVARWGEAGHVRGPR